MHMSEDEIFEFLQEQLVEGKADPDGEGFSMDLWVDWDKGLRTVAQRLRQTEIVKLQNGPTPSPVDVVERAFQENWEVVGRREKAEVAVSALVQTGWLHA